MSDNLLYKNKYRIPSARREAYDYSNDGFYFVTICTKKRMTYFGEIINNKMILSTIGQIAKQEWINTKKIRKNVKLHEFVIMPNHIHGIIQINNPITVETHGDASLQRGQRDNTTIVKTHSHASRHGEYKNKFGPQSKNLSSIIRGFKGTVTKHATINNINFAWQPRFHDHVIKNDGELNKIRYYITINPEKWELDRNNTKNLSRCCNTTSLRK